MIGDFRLDAPDAPAAGRPSEERAHAARPRLGEERAHAAPTGLDEERAHAARVEEHRAASGWGPAPAVRLATLATRLARSRRQSPVGPVPAGVAVLVAVADLVLAAGAISGAIAGDDRRADAGVLILLAMFVPTVWAAWTLTRLVQRRREGGYRAELDRLRLDQGCGDPACGRCA